MSQEFDADEEGLRRKILKEINEEADRENPVKKRAHLVSRLSVIQRGMEKNENPEK